MHTTERQIVIFGPVVAGPVAQRTPAALTVRRRVRSRLDSVAPRREEHGPAAGLAGPPHDHGSYGNLPGVPRRAGPSESQVHKDAVHVGGSARTSRVRGQGLRRLHLGGGSRQSAAGDPDLAGRQRSACARKECTNSGKRSCQKRMEDQQGCHKGAAIRRHDPSHRPYRR